MTKTPELSVIVPIYGWFDLARARVSVKSILSQKDIDYEVIVSEQGESRRFPEMPNVKHVFKYHRPQTELSDFNTGNVRNEAIMLATGKFVYTNDADIIFLEPDYLAKSVEAIRESPNKVLYRPFMRRLPLDEFNEFERRIQELGIDKAVESLDLSQEYLATLNSKSRKIRVFEKDSIYRKIFTAFEEDFQSYVGDDKNKGREPMFWNENRHGGGNLFRIEQFKDVGGYAEEFIAWGCEDSDLQWKFREVYNLQFFPENLEVMHLDHPKGYFSPEIWARNEEISRRRIQEGLEKIIERDRRNKLWHQ
ncbi:MAG: glycosyltransferase family 2 protein [Nanoarchaeota archaeon]